MCLSYFSFKKIHFQKYLFTSAFCFFLGWVNAQPLQPGLDKNELLEVMRVSVRTGGGESYINMPPRIPPPALFHLTYRSPVIGLDNLWELWVAQDRVIITIRGSVQTTESWLANLYAAMVPAQGSLRLSDSVKFDYALATDPQAAVHVGWLVATAFIYEDLKPRLDSCLRAGIRDFLITGHSQGGAIAYLLTAHLRSLQRSGRIDPEVRFKTYCTAAPKPGNLFFAYEYEQQTQAGWAYNIVNALDWVPEVPFSIQTIQDFNTVNPFNLLPDLIQKQSWPKRLVFKNLYKKLRRPPQEAQAFFEKYLGEKVAQQVVKSLPGFMPPKYASTNNYVRTGTIWVLKPDKAYGELFKEEPKKIFVHHFHQPYYYLIEKMPDPRPTAHP